MRRAALVAALVAGVLVPVWPRAEAAPGCDWPTYGHDAGRSFAALPGCSVLRPANAPTLIPKWVFRTSTPVTASPAVVAGVVYVGDWGGTFYALDAASGAPRWTFQIDDTNNSAFGRIVSSAAVTSVGDRQVVLFGGGATLYALDAASGTKLAALCLDPRDIGDLRCRSPRGDVEVESSPAIVTVAGEQHVLVGLDVHNDQNIGRTGIVHAALRPTPTGVDLVPLWKFDPEAADVYTGPDLLTRGSGTGSGCASVWSSPAVDVERNLVAFGTGSCSVDDVLTGERMWAIDLDDGELVWQYGPPRTSTRLDDDFGASPNMLPGGLVGEGGKDGSYYALRARPAHPGPGPGPGLGPELVWATQVGEAGHLSTDFAIGGIIGTPATGVVDGVPAIFVTTAISTPIANPVDDNPSLDTTLLADPQRLLSLTALRASDGAILWRSPLARASYGAPSFANGVVLVPSTFTFSLQAFDANTGLLLAVRPLGGAPSSSPVALGDSVYIGTGTSETDLEFKAFGADAVSALTGISSPLAPLSGVYAFRIPA
jgi:polyvinyl alcohol dehydrogenase (cytochrome)